MLSKYNFFRSCLTAWAIFLSVLCQGQEAKVKDELRPALSVKLTGFIEQRLHAAYNNRILTQDVNRLVVPFRNRTETRCWQSEFWGKWFTSAVLAYRYRPDIVLKKKLDAAVEQLIATQTSDGYIGNYAPAARLEQWDIWGRKYCLLGLLAYYDLQKDTKTLEAAKKLADHLIQELKDKNTLIVKKGNHRGMASSSVLEPICLLYSRTGEKRYLEFAKEIVKEWESESGPQLISRSAVPVAHRFPRPANWFGWEQGQKAYEMMSCYEGLLELYRLTGKQEYKEVVEHTWSSIEQTEMNITGSGSAAECWFGGKALQTLPVSHYQETCVTATWIKLNQQLLKLTAAAKYADAIEQSFYNSLLGAMTPLGTDWAKYSPLSGYRPRGEEQCGMGLNCCVASGPRGLFTLPLSSVMHQAKGIRVNFFVPGVYELTTPARQKVLVSQETNYPVKGAVALKLQLEKPETFSISIRIPSWSAQTVLMINGEPASSPTGGQYFTITRGWKNGDHISLNLDMRGRLVYSGNGDQHFAIQYGPLVLARDSRLGGPDTDDALVPVAGNNGYINLEPCEVKNNTFWVTFKAWVKTESHKEGPTDPVPVLLCDYASAGNTYSDASRFRVWTPLLFEPRYAK
ncbi:glycoside hydrolase family 127 protein [Niabella sp. CC-SYL272]|uniref:glycoside hydrolase family 127 protein n=1 Tax=Niabella agricola TaxID=2891571 RepID=UPI001F275E34|nr:beta-L-arabinofuranosidase domain-containing protein [Niabella agricola]MCF3107429.1 glycoside hydrolase family 127 protein [Niabella agricola]